MPGRWHLPAFNHKSAYAAHPSTHTSSAHTMQTHTSGTHKSLGDNGSESGASHVVQWLIVGFLVLLTVIVVFYIVYKTSFCNRSYQGAATRIINGYMRQSPMHQNQYLESIPGDQVEVGTQFADGMESFASTYRGPVDLALQRAMWRGNGHRSTEITPHGSYMVV